MEILKNLKPLFVAILLIAAGLISPSNGLDDSTKKTPLEMLTTVFYVVFSTMTIYAVSRLIEKRKESAKSLSQ